MRVETEAKFNEIVRTQKYVCTVAAKEGKTGRLAGATLRRTCIFLYDKSCVRSIMSFDLSTNRIYCVLQSTLHALRKRVSLKGIFLSATAR